MAAIINFSVAVVLTMGVRHVFAQVFQESHTRKGLVMSIQQRGRVRAPELTGGRGWLNIDQPLSLKGLRGKVVLLDFWTYGCINCIHIIPDLQRLEEKYANQLVVIGVHSAKFDNEKETDNIRRIILRYGIEHPVVNDADFEIWKNYAVRAWPTQVLIDPAGYIAGQVEGEGNYEAIDRAIAKTVQEFRARGELHEQPLKLALERAKVGDLPLAFPGKILADAKSDRLFIADSNHHRIVITKLDGGLIDTIGTGERGVSDGSYTQATFFRPQGLALDGDHLYIADTANHLLRRVDLKSKTVSTIAGTGRQSRGAGDGDGTARGTALSSPWDLHLAGSGENKTLYMAMAGPHQIWKLDLTSQQVAIFAGSGREARLDGTRRESGFAQPSGLTSDGQNLYVADSESNIIRSIGLKDKDEVKTLVGGDLFDFGDTDGRGNSVRLQHPLGVLFNEGKVFIADTYNHKIKELDPQQGRVKTFAGTGKPGQADGAAPSFYEPGGLSAANGKLYVADTNNHAVRVVDLQSKQTSTLKIAGLKPPVTKETTDAANSNAINTPGPNAEEIKLSPQRLRAESTGTLNIDVALPAGYHLNASAPQRYEVRIEQGEAHVVLGEPASEAASIGQANAPKVLRSTAKDLKLPLRLPLRALAPGVANLRLQLTLFYCREDDTGTCHIKTLMWRAPVEVTSQASAPVEIKAQGKVTVP